MDMFDVKRRDNPSLDQHMDPNKPPFGGPKEKADFYKNKRKSLDKYQRIVKRNRDFEGRLTNPATGEEMVQPNYDSTWKAITNDKISRDAKIKPTKAMSAKNTISTEPVEEGRILRFEQFVNEGFEAPEATEDQNLMQTEGEELDLQDTEEPTDLGYKVDEEQLEQVMEEYGDDINELIDKLVEEMEIEKEAAGALLGAAIEKICNPEDEDEASGEEAAGEDTETPEEPGA